MTPRGNGREPRPRRIRLAQSIKRDIAVAGCLPEHDYVTYTAAMHVAKRAAKAQP